MKKSYIIDSTVFLASPYCIFSFDEHDIFISYDTISLLNKIKKETNEYGLNAQESLRLLEELREKGSLSKGVNLAFGGGTLSVCTTSSLGNLCRADKEKKCIFVSDDIEHLLNAEKNGVKAERYKTHISSENYMGRKEIITDKIDEFYANKKIEYSNTEPSDILNVNEYVMLKDYIGKTALARYDGTNIVPILHDYNPYGVRPRNVGQKFAIDALMASPDEAPLVILKGAAGTAKTFLALACGLEQTIGTRNPIYDSILITRPNCKFDEDIGFLKGTEEDKIGPLLRPIWDNLSQLCKTEKGKSKLKETPDGEDTYTSYLFKKKIIEPQAMAYMRGRSITNTYIIIDEAQNMTPLQAFGLISRVGEGSKIVLTGDTEQIDNPNLDKYSNGLSYSSEKMKGSYLVRQLTFTDNECERSPLALEAISRMSPKGKYKKG